MAHGQIHQQYLIKGWLIIVPLGIIMFLVVLGRNVQHPLLYPLLLYINYLLCFIIDPDCDQLSLTIAEGTALRASKKFYLGFIGAVFVSSSFIYAYIIGLFGGHRSWASHGWLVGTIGRMIFYNTIPYFIILNIYSYGLTHWNWMLSINMYSSFFMNIWFIPYVVTQFIAWNIGDGIHLILDTNWAKGILYTPLKTQRGNDG